MYDKSGDNMKTRMLLATLAVLAMMAIAAAAETPGAPRFGNLDSAKAVSAKDGQPIILDFYADW
jgi:thiol:disulfide interchange protein